MRADVILEKDIAALVARTLEHFGQLDFAFKNAGVAGIANTSEIFDRTMNIKLPSVFFSYETSDSRDSQIRLPEESKAQAGRNIIQVRLPDSLLLL